MQRFRDVHRDILIWFMLLHMVNYNIHLGAAYFVVYYMTREGREVFISYDINVNGMTRAFHTNFHELAPYDS